MKLRKIVASTAIAITLLGTQLVSPDTAKAQVSYSPGVNWIGGRFMDAPSSDWTMGTWLRSTTLNRKYLLLPDHVLRPCRGCAPYSASEHKTYEGSSVNWFDLLTPSQIILPTNPNYAYYDMVLIDFGTSDSAPFNGVWNYCTAINCTSFQGGGTQKNCNWCGWHYHLLNANVSQAGWGVIISKAISGTSWGTIVGAQRLTYQGYDFWGIRVNGVSGCGATAGDSGSPISTGNNNETYLGMYVVGINRFTVPGPSPCYGYTTGVSSDIGYVAWPDIAAAYPGYGLVPYVYS